MPSNTDFGHLRMQSSPSNRRIERPAPHHDHTNERCRWVGRKSHRLGLETPPTPRMSVAGKWEFPSPTPPKIGAAITPTSTNADVAYGHINEAKTTVKRWGRVPWNETLVRGGIKCMKSVFWEIITDNKNITTINKQATKLRIRRQ